jgi:archaeosine-15-forming tRNA-guanine transglycosylase
LSRKSGEDTLTYNPYRQRCEGVKRRAGKAKGGRIREVISKKEPLSSAEACEGKDIPAERGAATSVSRKLPCPHRRGKAR